MPLFFVLAGFLTSNKNLSFPDYLQKNAHQLLVPYVFYYLLTLPFGLFIIYFHPHNHPFDGSVEFFLKPIVGLFLVKTTDISFHVNGPSWFFVALFISKILFFVNIKNKFKTKVLVLTNVLVLALYAILNYFEVNCYFRFTTALLGFSFITIGYLLKKIMSYTH